MEVTGKARIYVNEYQGANGLYKKYATSIATKDKDGEYQKIYPAVYFRGGASGEGLCNGDDIEIKRGFLTVDSYKNKKGELVCKPSIVVLEFENNGHFEEIDELPF